MRVTVIPIAIDALGTVPKSLERELEELEIRRKFETNLKVAQNTEKSPGDLRTLAVTQTPVKAQSVILV